MPPNLSITGDLVIITYRPWFTVVQLLLVYLLLALMAFAMIFMGNIYSMIIGMVLTGLVLLASYELFLIRGKLMRTLQINRSEMTATMRSNDGTATVRDTGEFQRIDIYKSSSPGRPRAEMLSAYMVCSNGAFQMITGMSHNKVMTAVKSVSRWLNVPVESKGKISMTEIPYQDLLFPRFDPWRSSGNR